MTHQCVAVGSHRIAFTVCGEGDPLVLVHGLAGSGRWWARNVDVLARFRRVYVMDLPGFGASTAGAACTMATLPSILLEWADRVGIGAAAWVGHSMGGQIVAHLAIDAPERVSHLVLVDATVFEAGPDWPVSPGGVAAALFHAPRSLLPVLAADIIRAGPIATIRSTRDVLATGIEDELPNIRVPTLVIWGERDTIATPDVGRRLAVRVPGALLVVIPGADHAPMWSTDDAFNAEIVRFLGEGHTNFG